MDTSQFKRIETLFEEALQRPEAERRGFVEKACGADAAMRVRVLRMLEHAGRDLACEEVEAARRTALGGSAASPVDDLAGTTIGPYNVIELLGEGGFGSVYLAEQQSPVRRRVAIKVIKLGMDTAQVLARFESERQALAMMDHPHVARVFDAGVTGSGRPYVVMELVDGEPITRFCDERRLDVAQRLRLFAQVCRAVQHAHAKGVIHRDLKPSNILVTVHEGVAAPRIIDFGIAKAMHGRLGERTVATALWQFIGTPDYVSPEQASGRISDVDTRSDVYSLGVVLHELLVGDTPFVVATPGRPPQMEEMVRLIVEQEPRRPSTRLSALGRRLAAVAALRSTDPGTLRRALRGDLDWIVLKALAKDPVRRYESAADLAHDIERFLEHRPVEARPPGAVYLAGKFVRRHRVAMSAAAIVVLVVVAGLVTSLLGWRQAIDAREGQREALEAARERLRESLVAQAAAARSGHEIGRRGRALAALVQAAQIRSDDELRDETVACLSLDDFDLVARIPVHGWIGARGLRTIDRFAEIRRPGEITIRALPDGRDVHVLKGPPMLARAVLFSPDGRWIAAKSHERTDDVRLDFWRDGAPAPVLELKRATSDEAFALCQVDGYPAVAIGGRDARIEVLSIPEGAPLVSLRLEQPVLGFACAPDGDRLVVSHYEPARIGVWSIRQARRVLEIEPPAHINTVAFTGDGELILGCGYDRILHAWTALDGAPRGSLAGHQAVVSDVAPSADSTMAVTHGWDGTTRLWDLRARRAMANPLPNVRIGAFGDALLVDEGGQAALWRHQPSRCFRSIATPSSPDFGAWLALSADGHLIAAAGADGVRVWNARDGRKLLESTDRPATFVRFVDGGEAMLVATSEGVERWTLDDAGQPSRVTTSTLMLRAEGIVGAEVDARCGRMALLRPGAIEVLALPGLERVASLPGYRGMSSVTSLDPSGRWLFTGNWRGDAARVWDLETGEVVLECPATHVVGAFSPGGEGLVVSTGPSHELRRPGTWEPVRTRLRNHTGDLAGQATFSGSGRVMALTDARHDVHLVETASGRTLVRLAAPEPAFITRIAMSADGSVLAAVTSIDEIHVWDLSAMRGELAAIGLDWEGGQP